MSQRSLRPPKTEQARKDMEKTLHRNRIVWSKVEPAIQDTDADVLLIFDCCHAGRLSRPYRGFDRSFFEFLGACSEDQTTMGPGASSFTRALTWALKELARKEEAFSTAVLRDTIMKYDRFPESQYPVLSDRHLPGEHILISRKGLGSQSNTAAPSKVERAKELENKEYIELRFHFDNKIEDDHFDETANVLKSLMGSSKARWSRVTFVEKNSVLEKSAMKWRQAFLSRKKSNSIASAYPPAYLDGQVISPDLERTLSPRLPTHPYTPMASGRASRSSSVGPDWERATLVETRTRNQQHKQNHQEEPILFHIKAIARRIRGLACSSLAWLRNKVRFPFLICQTNACSYKTAPSTYRLRTC